MKTFSLLSTRLITSLLLVIAFGSCEKSIDPETKAAGSGKISYVAKASVSAANTATAKSIDTATTVNVTWSSATVYVEKISFLGKRNGLLDTTISVEKKLNIFNEIALAGVVGLPPGSYKDIQVKMYFRKSLKSDLAFHFRGTFKNIAGGTDSVLVGSSFPFEANLSVPEIVIDPSGNYSATFNFDLNKVLTGISTRQIALARFYLGKDGKKTYAIYKGGSADEPFYDQVIQNWQTVASVVIGKDNKQ